MLRTLPCKFLKMFPYLDATGKLPAPLPRTRQAAKAVPTAPAVSAQSGTTRLHGTVQ